MNIRRAVAEFFHMDCLTDGRNEEQTNGTGRETERDTTKLIVAFRNFAEAPTKSTTVLTSKIPNA
jgi:hypothetical protein